MSNHPVYRKQYIAHIRTIINEVLDIPNLTAEAYGMHDIISEAALEDNNAFFGLGDLFFNHNVENNVDFFGLKIAGLTDAAENRKEYLNAHPEVASTPPIVTNVVHTPEMPVANETVFVTAFVENATQVNLMVTKSKFNSHFEAITMFDDGMHGDSAPGDMIFGAAVPFYQGEDHIKYYIRAQNPEAMMLNPERAEYVFYEYFVENATSTHDQSLTFSDFQIFPNPSNGIFHLQFSDDEKVSEFINIYDLNGALIEQIKCEKNSSSINLSHIPAGIYVIYNKMFAPQKIVLF